MDPLSVTASIIACLQASGALISYFNTVRTASKEQHEFMLEISSLQSILQIVRCRVETAKAQPDTAWFDEVRKFAVPDGLLAQLTSSIEKLTDDIKKRQWKRFFAKALWKLDKASIEEVLARIGRLKTSAIMAMQQDQFSLSLSTHAAVQGIDTKLDIHHKDSSRTKIKSWLNLPSYDGNLQYAIDGRTPGTGKWLLDHRSYQDWKSAPASLMWLHGKPGCGKTFLSATVIENIQSNVQQSAQIRMAYVFFDFTNVDKQRADTLLRSILFQLASFSSTDALDRLHVECQQGRGPPQKEQVRSLLEKVLSQDAETFIILDALDECKEREQLLEDMQWLAKRCHQNTHILATSRPETEIRQAFECLKHTAIDIQSNILNADIESFVEEQLAKNRYLKRMPIRLREEVRDNIIGKADGMFRWVECQLTSIAKANTEAKVRLALAAMSTTLHGTYDRIIRQIEDNDHLEQATCILQWLCFSLRPMRLEELVEVMAIQTGYESGFDLENRVFNSEEVLTICSSLVTSQRIVLRKLSKGPMVYIEVRLAHSSVQEYLLSSPSFPACQFDARQGHMLLAEASLVYLLHLSEIEIECGQMLKEWPLAYYASHYWWQHYRKADQSSNNGCAKRIDQLFDADMRNILAWRRIQEETSFEPLLNDGVRSNATTSALFPSLLYAAKVGCTQIVRREIQRGFDVNFYDHATGTALLIACAEGHKDIVQELIKAGAEVDDPRKPCLDAACFNGHQDVAHLLIQAQANIDLNSGGPLFSAIDREDCQMMKFLIDAGADINVHDGRPLHTAVKKRSEQAVRVLIEAGVDINLWLACRGVPIVDASPWGDNHIVRMLIDAGVDVNAASGRALMWAAARGHEDVVLSLLAAGAKVNLGKGSWRPLRRARRYKQEKMVRLLQDVGAEDNDGESSGEDELEIIYW